MDRRRTASVVVRPGAERSGRSKALLRVAVGFALVLAVTGRGVSLARESSTSRGGPTYTLMQMNLCLSGFAGCFGKVGYPAGVQEAVGLVILLGLLVCPPLLILAVVVAAPLIAISVLVAAVVAAIAVPTFLVRRVRAHHRAHASTMFLHRLRR